MAGCLKLPGTHTHTPNGIRAFLELYHLSSKVCYFAQAVKKNLLKLREANIRGEIRAV